MEARLHLYREMPLTAAQMVLPGQWGRLGEVGGSVPTRDSRAAHLSPALRLLLPIPNSWVFNSLRLVFLFVEKKKKPM